jgi:hypothetical protein
MSLGARILLAVFATLFGYIMFLHGTTADPDKAWFSYAFGGFCFFIAAASVLKGRAAQFCGSVVGSCVFVSGLLYLGYELLSGPVVSGSRSESSVINALRFLMVFGVPGLLYTARARFGFGRVQAQPDAPVEAPAASPPE